MWGEIIGSILLKVITSAPVNPPVPTGPVTAPVIRGPDKMLVKRLQGLINKMRVRFSIPVQEVVEDGEWGPQTEQALTKMLDTVDTIVA